MGYLNYILNFEIFELFETLFEHRIFEQKQKMWKFIMSFRSFATNLYDVAFMYNVPSRSVRIRDGGREHIQFRRIYQL